MRAHTWRSTDGAVGHAGLRGALGYLRDGLVSGLVGGVPPRRVVLAGLAAAARGHDPGQAELRAAVRQACRTGLRPLRSAAHDLDLGLCSAGYGQGGVTAVTLEHRIGGRAERPGARRLLVVTARHAGALDEGVLAHRTDAYATGRVQGSSPDAAEAAVRRSWTVTEDAMEIDGAAVPGRRYRLAGEWLWTGAHAARFVTVHAVGVDGAGLRLRSLGAADLDG